MFAEFSLHELSRAEIAAARNSTSGRVVVDSPLGLPVVLAATVRQALASVSGPLGEPVATAVVEGVLQAWASAPSPLAVPVAAATPVVVGWAALPGPLGVVAVLAASPVVVRVDVPGPLGQPFLLALVPTVATASAPSVLGAAGVLAYHDFTAGLGHAVARYVMDLVVPSGLVRVPISSWQATLQQGRSNYVQCVVPAVADWVSAIDVATEFVVSRRAELADGSVIEYEMTRAPLGEARFDRGAMRYTGTLSGYSPGFAVDEVSDPVTDRVLAAVRSVSSGAGGRRVRCAVDWLLRPGQRAVVDGEPFTAAYINYYVGEGDAYMDVGERVVA